MPERNKVKFGLSRAYWARLRTSNGITTYDTPIYLPGAVSLELAAKGDVTKFRAENIDYFISATNNGYEGTLEVAIFPEDFRQEILGEQEDNKKVMYESSDRLLNSFALLFEFQGDIHSIKHVLYNVTPTRPSIASKTTEEKTEVISESISLYASPTIDTHIVRAYTKTETDQVVCDSWYTKVYTVTEI